MAVLRVHLAILAFGLTGLFPKLLPLGPWALVAGRLLFSLLGLVVIFAALRRRPRWSWGLALSGLVLGIHWASFFGAVHYSTVAVGLLSFSTYPVFAVIIQPGRRPLDFLWAFLCLGGVALVVPNFDLGDANALGVLLGVFAGFTCAILGLMSEHYVRFFEPIEVAFMQSAAAAIVFLPAFGRELLVLAPLDWLKLAVLGVVLTALAHTLYISGLRTVSAKYASLATCLEPLYGIVLAIFLLDEYPSSRALMGGAVILGTVLVATLSRPRPCLEVAPSLADSHGGHDRRASTPVPRG